VVTEGNRINLGQGRIRKDEQKSRHPATGNFFLTTASLAHAQQPKKIPLIGYLSANEPATESTLFQAIGLALRERGFIEGQNIASEYRYAERKLDRAPGLLFVALNKQRPGGLYVLPSGPLIFANQKRIAGLALKSRLPSMYFSGEAVEAGGLMSDAADLADSHKRVAYYVDRILKGAKPADLPVEQPMKFDFVINLKTANQIGLTIPQSVLFRATKVIQ